MLKRTITGVVLIAVLVAVLLCCGYLLLRRRVRPIPTAVMLFLMAVT